MLRVIFLIAPVFVCLFWVVVLSDNPKSHSVPRSFFGRLMYLPLVIYFAHFLYFAPFPKIFPYFDLIFNFLSLFSYPVYYIYFRLLTIDQKFSLKKHGKFFIPGIIVGIIYAVAFIIAPQKEYHVWLYNQDAHSDNFYVKSLILTRTLVKFTYLIQVLLVVVGNYQLIRKYGDRAEQYYSDIRDGKNHNASILNLTFVLISITTIILAVMGRYEMKANDYLIYIGWSVYSVLLFVGGYLGFKLKPINPTFEILNTTNNQNQQLGDIAPTVQKKIADKLEVEFEQKKVFLNSQLNIMDVVEAVGTNRTYISLIINQKYNQNFCSFVNGYRIEELKRVYSSNPEYTNETLAQCCGFGSLNSMKRAVFSKTGMSVQDWKKKVIAGSE